MNDYKIYGELPVSIKETLVLIPARFAQENEKAFFVRCPQIANVLGAAYCFDLLYIIKDLIGRKRIDKPDYAAYKPEPTKMPFALKRFLTNPNRLFLTFHEQAEQKAIYDTFEIALGSTRDAVWDAYRNYTDYIHSMDIQLFSRLPQELIAQFGYQNDATIIPALQLCGEVLLEGKMSDKALIALKRLELIQRENNKVMQLFLLIPAFAMLWAEVKIPPAYLKQQQYQRLINALRLQ